MTSRLRAAFLLPKISKKKKFDIASFGRTGRVHAKYINSTNVQDAHTNDSQRSHAGDI